MSKQKIVLDLDETLISSEPIENYNQNNKEKANKFKYHNMDSYYIVFERPGLQKFLNFLFDNFDVSVWTAASKDYALFIIDKIILKNKNRKLDWIFFSYHCKISKFFTNNTKNLNIIWDLYKIPGYNKNNTYIIDDYDEVYKTQPNNCIRAPPFDFKEENSHNDKFLKELQIKLTSII